MLRTYLLRLAVSSMFFMLLPSCAHRTSENSFLSSSKTPSGMINDFKAHSQKSDLDKIISDANYRKHSFLRPNNGSKVKMWIKYFTTRGKGSYKRYLENGEKYRPLIERIFAEHNLPKELYFVGLIESGYYLKAKSHADAVGPWQFIKSTAKRYGLKVRHDVDERRSIIKSTQAAALFFGDLYNIFGSWELALAAYNAGEYGVIRRIRKAKTRDFYKLSKMKKLPKETRNYVPKVIAAMHVYNNAKRYGVNIPIYKNDHYKDLKKVVVRRSTYTRDLARKYSISHATLKKLNFGLKRNATPTTKFTMYIPENSRLTSFKAKTVPKVTRVIATTQNYKIHKVKSGDNLTWMARKYKTSISNLVRINRLKRRTIFIGQKLKVPTQNIKTYTVRSGDFLLKIAKRHKLSIAELKQINEMKSTKIFPGQKLIVSIN